VDPRAGLDNIKIKNDCPPRDSNSNLFVVQRVASSYTDCAIPVLQIIQIKFRFEEPAIPIVNFL
jgi:hypothetical protein